MKHLLEYRQILQSYNTCDLKNINRICYKKITANESRLYFHKYQKDLNITISIRMNIKH